MVVSLVLNSILFVVCCLLLADINFGITHNYIYSAVMCILAGAAVCSLLLVLPIKLKKKNKQQIETSEFKFYKPLKIKWYQKLSATNVALFFWMMLTVAFSAVDKYFERNVQVVYDLPVLSSGLVTTGRGTPGAYVVVEDNGRRVRCRRGSYHHLVNKGKPLSADLVYSETFIGFEQTDCSVRLSEFNSNHAMNPS